MPGRRTLTKIPIDPQTTSEELLEFRNSGEDGFSQIRHHVPRPPVAAVVFCSWQRRCLKDRQNAFGRRDLSDLVENLINMLEG
jgi:hypothetical protein